MGPILEVLLPILIVMLVVGGLVGLFKFVRKKDPGEAEQAYKEFCDARKELVKEVERLRRATQELLVVARELDTTLVLSRPLNTTIPSPNEEVEGRDAERRVRVKAGG